MWYLLLLAASACAFPQVPWSASPKVNVTLYVMSRCPDARLCESVFDKVIESVGSKIDLSLGYIAASNRSEPLGYSCKHGELECTGNAHQLCLHKYLPLNPFYANLACQNYDYEDIGKLSLTKRCAESSKVDWRASGVGKCVEGDESRALLKENVERTRATGITTSCTVVIESALVHGGIRRCEVDGGAWRGCNDGHTSSDFIRVIEAEWKNLRHA